MKILITSGLAVNLTDPDKRYSYQPYEHIREDLGEVEIGDTVVVSYDGDQEVGEVAINPTQERITDMEERVMEMSQTTAEMTAEENGDTPENWKNYLTDGYPLMVWYKAVKSEDDEDDAGLEVIDMKELL